MNIDDAIQAYNVLAEYTEGNKMHVYCQVCGEEIMIQPDTLLRVELVIDAVMSEYPHKIYVENTSIVYDFADYHTLIGRKQPYYYPFIYIASDGSRAVDIAPTYHTNRLRYIKLWYVCPHCNTTTTNHTVFITDLYAEYGDNYFIRSVKEAIQEYAKTVTARYAGQEKNDTEERDRDPPPYTTFCIPVEHRAPGIVGNIT